MNFVREPEREIKVCQTVDLCVVGGSCTGVFAAVRAARLGIRVAIVEQANCLGGVATSGLVNVWHKLWDTDYKQQIIAGLTQEMLDRLQRVGAVKKSGDQSPDNLAVYALNTEELKIELDSLILEAKITPYFHTRYCAAYREDDILKAIIIENKNGRQAIQANFFIDASGDGDIARDLGLRSFLHSRLQPPSPTYKLYGSLQGVNLSELIQRHGPEFGLPEDWGWSGPIPGMEDVSFRADTHVFGADCADAGSLSRAEMEGRRQVRAVMDILRTYVDPDRFALAALYSSLGIRDTRHFESEFQVQGDDLLMGTPYEDTVAYGTYPLDRHHSHDVGITFRHLEGYERVHHDRASPPEIRKWRKDGDHARYYQVPFRTLIQKKVGNFIAVGRMINADEQAFAGLRVMVNLNQLGEAAGVAAYHCLNGGIPVHEADAQKIRTLLRQGGSAIL